MDDFSLNQEEVAQKVGKKPLGRGQFLRLLNLDERVQELVLENKISGGHARAILGLEDSSKQLETAEKDN